jgi:hypothetical protein
MVKQRCLAANCVGRVDVTDRRAGWCGPRGGTACGEKNDLVGKACGLSGIVGDKQNSFAPERFGGKLLHIGACARI